MTDFKFEPRVWETTTSTGTGNLSLSGVSTLDTALRTFTAAGFTNLTSPFLVYLIKHQTLNEWELGLGSQGAGTFIRHTPYLSSNANALVSLSAGTKDLFLITHPGFAGGTHTVDADTSLGILHEVVYVNSGSSRTITLPLANSYIGKRFTVVKGGSGNPVISRSGSDSILTPLGSVTSLTLTDLYSAVSFVSIGSDSWAAISNPSRYDRLSNLVNSEVSITAATTLTSSAFGKTHVISGTTADYTVTLPTVSGNSGKFISFRIAPIASANRLYLIDANGTETIDGLTSRFMWANETATLYCTGTEWTKVAGRGIAMDCTLRRESAQSIAYNTWTQIACTTRVEDNTQSLAVPLGNLTNGRAQILRPGRYLATGFASIGGVTAGREFNGGVSRNNASPQDNPNAFTTVSVPTAGAAQACGAAKFNCSAGDWIGAVCFHDDSGGSKNTRAVGTVYPSLSVCELNPW